MSKSLLMLAALFVVTSATAAPGGSDRTRPARQVAASCAGAECAAKYGERRSTVALRRDAQRYYRFYAKKQLCRQYDVRWDRSGLCW